MRCCLAPDLELNLSHSRGDAKGWTEDRYREVPQKAVSRGEEEARQQQDLPGLQKLFQEGLGLLTEGGGDSSSELQDRRAEGDALKARTQGCLRTPARPSSCLGASEP